DQPMLFVYPINDIALAPRTGDGEYSHACYVGTETGVCFCLLVGFVAAERERRNIVARQLWRDLHRGPVVAVRPWSDTHKDDLYDEPVVFVATQTGNLSIYHAGHGSQTEPRLRGSGNYRFEGIRFDRIDLPAGLTSWAIRQGRSAFLAAYPNGRLLFGELYGPRESTVRDGLLSKLDELYGKVNLASAFFGNDERATDELEICAMIRIGDGALRSYILRKQLEQRAWDSLGEAEIDALLAGYLDRLSPEVVEERDQIKIVIDVVTSHVLDRSPAEILENCRPGRSYDKVARYGHVVRTCERLKRYLLDGAVQAQPGVIRVRMVIMAALFRAHVFSYLPVDDASQRRIRKALREVLTACLRDDDRIVRIEALRAVAAALRSIRVLFDQADDDAHREELRASFFPRGPKTIQWLVDALLENFARYRRHGEPVLLSTAWSYTTVLVAMIRLFPGDALELCDQISRWGLGDNLEILAERLRGRHVESVRWRIRELCVVPSVRQQAQAQARDEFIRAFEDVNVGQALAEHKIAPSDGDYLRASELLHAYRRLALLWKVNHQADIADIPLRWSHSGELPEMSGSLAGVKRSLEALVEIARAGLDERAARLRELRSQITSGWRDGHKPPDAVRLVLERVIERWQAVVEPKIPTPGEKIGLYVLGRLITVRGNGLVYELEGDSTRVMKVLRDPLDMAARQEFNRDARLSRELAERYPASFVGVHSLEPTSGYAVMDRFKPVRELDPVKRAPLAAIAAPQLARALRCLHEEDLAHGNLRAANVFVTEGPESAFRLGDLHAVTGSDAWPQAAHQIPRLLQEPAATVKPAHWIDRVSLALFLAWLVTGETLAQDADAQALAQLASRLKTCGVTGGDGIARMLLHLWERSPTTAHQLEWLIGPGMPSGFERKPLAGRPLVRFDVFISYNSQNIAVARSLYTELVGRGLVPYLDEREAVSDRWRLEIRHAMDECRAFAILIGSKYRKDAAQPKEVSAAREESQKHNLPLKVFLLGSERPAEFQAVLQDHPVIQVEQNVRLMADEIVRSFQPPSARPGNDPAL
ncbi:MAG TPA: TIR domain-containing protein, partial [Kofleriaceae bacterium]